MTNGSNTATKHWAILIGIDFYVKDRHLQGSVQDVETVKQYLNPENPPVNSPVDIVILTATTPPDPSTGRPIEKPDLWPTNSNVVSGLKRVIERGNPGDFVYIHFSGHGTRRPKSLVGPQRKGTGDLALVLFESNGCSYFSGEVLATALRKMVDKGLFVTLVLDCCFSGSAVRYSGNQGVGIRGTDYNPAFDVESLRGHQESSSGIAGTLRDVQVFPEWLINPRGYAILSACGPYEKAWELEVEGRQRGALSYFLIDALSTLREKGEELTHQSLYQYLRIRFHASWPQQTPMRYGNGNSSFFGNLGVALDRALIPIYKAHDDRLCLSAGEAHGVCKGDEYAAYPFHTGESVLHQTKEAAVAVRVDTVRCLTSDLLEIEPASAAKKIVTGWKAKPVTNLSPWRMSVRLMASVSNPNQWIEAAKQQRFLCLSTENAELDSCIFTLILNEHKEYEVLDGHGKIVIGLPTVPVDTNGALNVVVDVLQHLAKFKYFEGVENRRPSLTFERSFSLLPFCDNRASDDCNLKHGAKWGLTIENFSDRPLYVAIFNCTPSWRIVNLISSAGGGGFLVVGPKGERNNGKQDVCYQMRVPESLQKRGLTQCEDIIKVFVTSKPTSFSSVILPEIPLEARDLHGHVRGAGDQLSKFLSELTSGHRGQVDGMQEEWATRNFIICTAID